MTAEDLTPVQEVRVRTEAAAICGIGALPKCAWYSSGTEAEISAAAELHAGENPGHRVTCQVKETRTWAVLRDAPDTTKGEQR